MDQEIEQEEKQEQEISFPFLIFLLAFIKDIADWVTLGIGGTIITLIVAPILYFYYRKRIGFKAKKFWMRQIAEFVPGVNFIPLNSIFVVKSFLNEKYK